MNRAPRIVAAAALLGALVASPGCSFGLLHTLGDTALPQEADVVGTTRPDSNLGGEITVLVSCTDDSHESRVVTFNVPVELGPWKNARVVKPQVVDKEGALEDEHVYHRVEIERDQGWEELGEVEGYSHPSSTGRRVFVGILVPVAAAFDLALSPIYIWGAIFVKFVLPEKPFG